VVGIEGLKTGLSGVGTWGTKIGGWIWSFAELCSIFTSQIWRITARRLGTTGCTGSALEFARALTKRWTVPRRHSWVVRKLQLTCQVTQWRDPWPGALRPCGGPGYGRERRWKTELRRDLHTIEALNRPKEHAPDANQI
jgi:hypothetical protein